MLWVLKLQVLIAGEASEGKNGLIERMLEDVISNGVTGGSLVLCPYYFVDIIDGYTDQPSPSNFLLGLE